MHAWPELYFDGAGWVRFEPTPAGRAEDVPALHRPGGSGPDDEPQQPRRPPRRARRRRRRPTGRATAETAAAAADDRRRRRLRRPVAAGRSAALGGAARGRRRRCCCPATVRSRRRERRLSSGGAEPVWAELRDTAVDLGVPWPRGPLAARHPRRARRPPRRAARARHTPSGPPHGPDVAPEAVGALDRLVHDARAGPLLALRRRPSTRCALRADGEACVAALAGGAPRSARRRATWWPRSVLVLAAAGVPPRHRRGEVRRGGRPRDVSADAGRRPQVESATDDARSRVSAALAARPVAERLRSRRLAAAAPALVHPVHEGAVGGGGAASAWYGGHRR